MESAVTDSLTTPRRDDRGCGARERAKISGSIGGLWPEQERGGDQIALVARALGSARVAARWKELVDLGECIAVGHCDLQYLN
jgi:hypothetical protein